MIRQDPPVARISEKGQPVKGKKPCLTVLTGGPVGMLYTLSSAAATLIGRARDADVRLTNRRASRRHAKILINPAGGATLEDLGSTNGTYINGTQIRTYRLQDGDRVRIGPSAILKFSYQDDLERDFHQGLIDSEIRDSLTGTYTRKYAFDQIVGACAHARRYKTPLALLMFEIDGFWKINDMYGDPAGNYVVKKLARVVRSALRTDDVFARLSANTFAVLARDVDDKGTVTLGRRIRRAVRSRKFLFQDVRLPVSISLGIATLSEGVTEPAKLLQTAEGYLRLAKYGGGGCIGGRAIKSLAA